MIGLGAPVGVKPAPEYMLMIFVTPVGPYFKGGFQPSKVCVLREYVKIKAFSVCRYYTVTALLRFYATC